MWMRKVIGVCMYICSSYDYEIPKALTYPPVAHNGVSCPVTALRTHNCTARGRERDAQVTARASCCWDDRRFVYLQEGRPYVT